MWAYGNQTCQQHEKHNKNVLDEETHEKFGRKLRIIFKVRIKSRVSCVATNKIYSQLTVHVFQRWTPAANGIELVTLGI